MADLPLPHTAMSAARRACRPPLLAAAVFSAAINLLYLTPTIFMLQVYDRVVPTGGLVTLLLVGLVTVLSLAVLALLDGMRGRLLAKAGACLDSALAGAVFTAVMRRPESSRVERTDALRDLDGLRAMLSGPAVVALLDAPWTPVYIFAALLIHPLLGLFTLAAGMVLCMLAWRTERRSRSLLTDASRAAATAYARQSQMTFYAAEARAMGMIDGLCSSAMAERHQTTSRQIKATIAMVTLGSVTKFVRLAAQSGALALAAWLVINGAISAGAIFAASLLLGRALAPIELLIGSWKTIIRGRDAHARLTAILAADPVDEPLRLPNAVGLVEVEQLHIQIPGGQAVLSGVSLRLEPGALVCVAGSSGAGKSTLLRAISGCISPSLGAIRIDGAALQDWPAHQLSDAMAYLPQESLLFSGSIKDNIASFRYAAGDDADPLDAAVVKAARLIGTHEMILRLPNGYETLVGPGGYGLSAGQAQRVAIARVLCGSPRIILMDEPSSHLDADSKITLIALLKTLCSQGVTILVATHDSDILAAADHIALLAAGRLARYGAVVRNTLPPLRQRA